MSVRGQDFAFPETPRLSRNHAWVGALVSAIDDRLRRRHGVVEYTRDRDCMFRIQVAASARQLMLSDDTRISAGDTVINLHLWNEQVPPMSGRGPTLAWARRMERTLERSLCALARYLAIHPELNDVAGVYANLSLATAARGDRLAAVMQRFGFEAVATPAPVSLGERLHRLGENIFISLIVLARNPMALRSDSLRRDRILMCLSRRALERRYGSGRGHGAWASPEQP
jgi:hypothetical protein